MTNYKLTPLRAIKKYCKMHCCAGDIPSWKECGDEECPLFIYRIGKNPKRKGIGGKNKDK